MEFLLHAGSLSEFDVAAFGYAIHELMVRVGVALPSDHVEGALSEQQIWAAIEAGLIWLRRLHSLMPPDDEQGQSAMRDRLTSDDLGPVMKDMRQARRRAKWGGGFPVWFVALNSFTCLAIVVGVTVLLARGLPQQVHASESSAFVYEQRIVDLESQLRAANEDATYRQVRSVEAIAELRERAGELQAQILELQERIND